MLKPEQYWGVFRLEIFFNPVARSSEDEQFLFWHVHTIANSDY